MSRIADCIGKYQNTFEEDWICNISWSENPDSDLPMHIAKIMEYSAFCFRTLSISMLSGEYVNNKQSVRQELNDFICLINEHEYISEGTDYEKLLSENFSALDRSIVKCLELYSYLICVYDNKYEGESISSFFISHEDIYTSSMIGQLRYFAEFVQPICKIEYNLSYQDSLISDLFYMSKSLSKVNDIPDDIKIILIDKVSFLLFKLQHVKDNKTIVYYDSIRIEIRNEDFNSEKLDELKNKFNHLFNEDELNNFISNNFSSLEYRLNNTPERISISDMITLTKCYQKLSGREDKIQKVIDLFQTIPVGTSRYDIYSYNVLKNYLHNSLFSEELKDDSIELEDFFSDYNYILSIQRETDIRNFHPHLKALEYIKRKISEAIDSENFSSYDDLFDQFSQIIKILKKSIDWCSRRAFYAFQLSYNDSLITYDSGISVFYPSSFSRPLRYDKLREQLSEFERDYDIFCAQKKLIIERKNISTIKLEVETAKKMIVETKKDSVKILGAFTTVVTFLFGSIDVFAKTKDFKETLLASLGLGMVLYLFCTIIYYFSASEEDYEQRSVRFHLIFWGMVLALLIIIIFFFSLR